VSRCGTGYLHEAERKIVFKILEYKAPDCLSEKYFPSVSLVSLSFMELLMHTGIMLLTWNRGDVKGPVRGIVTIGKEI